MFREYNLKVLLSSFKKSKIGEVEAKSKGIELRLYNSTSLKRANFASKKLYNWAKSINIRKI